MKYPVLYVIAVRSFWGNGWGGAEIVVSSGLTLDTTVDPGNYATDIAAGASYRFRLLFVILVSNLIAIFLQNLAIKLGTVTGLNLAEACRAFLPRWLNYFLYFMAEAAIIATDIAEVSLMKLGCLEGRDVFKCVKRNG